MRSRNTSRRTPTFIAIPAECGTAIIPNRISCWSHCRLLSLHAGCRPPCAIRHHSVDQQLCRWLLLSLDRLPSNQLVMTQELIANMLGVRREGVTEAAGKLEILGVIRYARGKITVLDRPRLEQRCCECYAVVKRETDRLRPPAYQSQDEGQVLLPIAG